MAGEVGNAGEVGERVAQELSRITNLPLKEALRDFTIEPFRQMRRWDYSTTGEMFPCWIVARFPRHDMGLAYCGFGHGQRGDRWGIVQLSANNFGRDESWFLRLEDAFINSGFWTGPVPDDYEIP